MANNTGQIILIGAIGLAAVYLIANKPQSPYYPQQPTVPQTQTQQQQLLNWANTQSPSTIQTITNIIKGLDWQGIADMWSKIFGSGSSSGDYSGGGTDVPYNPYPEYDPYNDGGIWA